MLFAGAAHPWVKEGGDASDMPLDISVLSNMREFVKYSRLKQLALRVRYSFLSNLPSNLQVEVSTVSSCKDICFFSGLFGGLLALASP
jgi:hypothetical protein